MTHSAIHVEGSLALLQWRSPTGEINSFSLHEGETIVVGSHADADVQLPFPRVSGKHCILWMDKGKVYVRDCYSSAGTLLGGRRITEMDVTGEQELQIGSCKLSIRCGAETLGPGQFVRNENRLLELGGNRADQPSDMHRATTASPDADPLQLVVDDLKLQVAQLDRENAVLRERIELLVQRPGEPVGEADPFQQEMLELLRSEIGELQRQLEERSHAAGPTVPSPDGGCSGVDVERLADRLETLLEELGEKDRQLTLVTDLLASAEAAAQAEHDERRQLEHWLGDVEARVSDRDQEWRSQLDAMKRKIGDLTEERNHAQTALLAKTDNAKLESAMRLCDELRAENLKLQSRLAETEEEIRRLRRQCDESLELQRQEAVRISQERAELARTKHALEQIRHDLDQKERKLQIAGAADAARLQQIPPAPKPTSPPDAEESLARRIGRLWRRLDSW